MVLWIKNTLYLAVVVAVTAACGMMKDQSTTAHNGKHDWFEYAYTSSAVNFEHEDDSDSYKPTRMKLPTH